MILTIGAILLGLAACYLVIRPLMAIGDIPDEIRRLKESIDNLSEIIKNKENKE